MVLIRFASALVAASMLAVALAQDASTTTIKNPITTPTVIVKANPIVDVGCFATGTPLENHGSYLFQTGGNCQLVCLGLGKDVMAVSDGEDCWCGDKIPYQKWQVDNKTCDTTCAGSNQYFCALFLLFCCEHY